MVWPLVCCGLQPPPSEGSHQQLTKACAEENLCIALGAGQGDTVCGPVEAGGPQLQHLPPLGPLAGVYGMSGVYGIAFPRLLDVSSLGRTLGSSYTQGD